MSDKDIKTTECPECGCKETKHDDLFDEGYRVCTYCEQEWYTTTDYTTD